jgi:hypothetical protein
LQIEENGCLVEPNGEEVQDLVVGLQNRQCHDHSTNLLAWHSTKIDNIPEAS